MVVDREASMDAIKVIVPSPTHGEDLMKPDREFNGEIAPAAEVDAMDAKYTHDLNPMKGSSILGPPGVKRLGGGWSFGGILSPYAQSESSKSLAVEAGRLSKISFCRDNSNDTFGNASNGSSFPAGTPPNSPPSGNKRSAPSPSKPPPPLLLPSPRGDSGGSNADDETGKEKGASLGDRSGEAVSAKLKRECVCEGVDHCALGHEQRDIISGGDVTGDTVCFGFRLDEEDGQGGMSTGDTLPVSWVDPHRPESLKSKVLGQGTDKSPEHTLVKQQNSLGRRDGLVNNRIRAKEGIRDKLVGKIPDNLNRRSNGYGLQGRETSALSAVPRSPSDELVHESWQWNDHPDIAEALCRLAEDLFSIEAVGVRRLKLDNLAIGLFHQSTQVCLNYSGQDRHVRESEALNDLGGVLWEFGCHPDLTGEAEQVGVAMRAEAERVFRRSLKICQDYHGPGNLFEAVVCVNIANCASARDGHSEAAGLQWRALGIRRGKLGTKHLDTADASSALAMTQKTLGRLGEAEALYRDASAIYSDLLGPHHWEAVNSLNSLAVVVGEMGGAQEEELLLRRAVKQCEGGPNPLPEELAPLLQNLGLVVGTNGRAGSVSSRRDKEIESEGLLRKALDLYKIGFGHFHPETAECMDKLGTAVAMNGNLTEAECLHRSALEMLEQQLDGTDHPQVGEALFNLSVVIGAQGGRLDEAEALLWRSLSLQRRFYGEDEWEVKCVLQRLAEVARAQGSREEERVAQAVFAGVAGSAVGTRLDTLFSSSREAFDGDSVDGRSGTVNSFLTSFNESEASSTKPRRVLVGKRGGVDTLYLSSSGGTKGQGQGQTWNSVVGSFLSSFADSADGIGSVREVGSGKGTLKAFAARGGREKSASSYMSSFNSGTEDLGPALELSTARQDTNKRLVAEDRNMLVSFMSSFAESIDETRLARNVGTMGNGQGVIKTSSFERGRSRWLDNSMSNFTIDENSEGAESSGGWGVQGRDLSHKELPVSATGSFLSSFDESVDASRPSRVLGKGKCRGVYKMFMDDLQGGVQLGKGLRGVGSFVSSFDESTKHEEETSAVGNKGAFGGGVRKLKARNDVVTNAPPAAVMIGSEGDAGSYRSSFNESVIGSCVEDNSENILTSLTRPNCIYPNIPGSDCHRSSSFSSCFSDGKNRREGGGSNLAKLAGKCGGGGSNNVRGGNEGTGAGWVCTSVNRSSKTMNDVGVGASSLSNSGSGGGGGDISKDSGRGGGGGDRVFLTPSGGVSRMGRVSPEALDSGSFVLSSIKPEGGELSTGLGGVAQGGSSKVVTQAAAARLVGLERENCAQGNEIEVGDPIAIDSPSGGFGSFSDSSENWSEGEDVGEGGSGEWQQDGEGESGSSVEHNQNSGEPDSAEGSVQSLGKVKARRLRRKALAIRRSLLKAAGLSLSSANADDQNQTFFSTAIAAAVDMSEERAEAAAAAAAGSGGGGGEGCCEDEDDDLPKTLAPLSSSAMSCNMRSARGLCTSTDGVIDRLTSSEQISGGGEAADHPCLGCTLNGGA